MRVAVLGVAASALLGGTLAVTPLTSVSPLLPPAGAQCGSDCGKVASVLVPETPTPSGSSGAPAAQVAGPHASPAAANAPGASQQPGGGPSAARAVPGGSSSGASAGGAPAGALPGLGGVPDVGGSPDVAGMAGLTSIPADAQAVQSVWGTVIGVPTSLVGLAGSTAGVASSVSLSLFYLEAAGLLPKNLSVPGLNFPSIPGLSVPNAAEAVPEAVAAVPGAAVAIPAVTSVLPSSVGLPGVGLPGVG